MEVEEAEKMGGGQGGKRSQESTADGAAATATATATATASASDGAAPKAKKYKRAGPVFVFKYQEGYSNAVRRTVRLEDLL